MLRRSFSKPDAPRLCRPALARMIDAIAMEAYRATIEPVLPQGAVMLAAGGYGKRELFPYATVDILVLLEGESPWVSLREPLAECVRLLWDAGLRLNHTVRTVSECLEFREQNIDLDINLLDLRYLAGDKALYSRFDNKWPAFLEKNGSKLSQHLSKHTRVRHAKFQNTRAPPRARYQGVSWRTARLESDRMAVAPGCRRSSRPVTSSTQAGEFLSAVRCFLHYHSHSDRNLLDVEAQEQMLAQPFTRAKRSRPSAATFRMDARIFPARLGDLQRSAPRLGRPGEDREFAGGEFSRLAIAPFQQRIHGFARANLSAESRAARKRSGGGAAAARVHRPARHCAGARNRAAFGSGPVRVRGVLRPAAAPVGHAGKHSFSAARRVGDAHSAARGSVGGAVSRMGCRWWIWWTPSPSIATPSTSTR